jgi:hypothetical protein
MRSNFSVIQILPYEKRFFPKTGKSDLLPFLTRTRGLYKLRTAEMPFFAFFNFSRMRNGLKGAGFRLLKLVFEAVGLGFKKHRV